LATSVHASTAGACYIQPKCVCGAEEQSANHIIFDCNADHVAELLFRAQWRNLKVRARRKLSWKRPTGQHLKKSFWLIRIWVDGYIKTLNHQKILRKTLKNNLLKTKTILLPKYKLGGDWFLHLACQGGAVRPSAPISYLTERVQ